MSAHILHDIDFRNIHLSRTSAPAAAQTSKSLSVPLPIPTHGYLNRSDRVYILHHLFKKFAYVKYIDGNGLVVVMLEHESTTRPFHPKDVVSLYVATFLCSFILPQTCLQSNFPNLWRRISIPARFHQIPMPSEYAFLSKRRSATYTRQRLRPSSNSIRNGGPCFR